MHPSTTALIALIIAAVVMVGGLIVIFTANVSFAQELPTLTIADVEITEGDTTTLNLVLSDAPDGVSGFFIDVTVPETISIQSASILDTRFLLATATISTSTPVVIDLRAIDLLDTVIPGSTNIVLATIGVRGEVIGQGAFTISVDRFDDDSGNIIAPILSPGTVTVLRRFPTIIGQSGVVVDLDGDGLVEDLNANGRMDFVDIVLMFVHLDSVEVQSNIDLFDFTGNGSVDFDDVVGMFQQLIGL